MATFGQGINPQLGATDYSAILRGAQAGAQMSAQGQAAIGQGIASVGSSIGGALQQYGEQKKVNQAKDGTIKARLKFFESIQNLDGVPESIKKQALDIASSINDPKKSIDERAALSQGAQEQLMNVLQLGFQVKDRQEKDRQMAMQREAVQAAQFINPNTGQFSPVAPKYSPEVQKMAQNQFMQEQIQKAQLEHLQSQSVKNLRGNQTQMTPMNMEQIGQLKQQGYDVDAVPLGNGMFGVKKISPFAPAATTTINLGSKMKEKAYESLIKKRDDEMFSMLASKPHVEAMDALLNAVDKDGKVITGALGKIELGAKSLINAAAGKPVYEDVAATQAYIGNSVNLVGQVIKQFGSGTGLSDADREYAEKAAAGNIVMDRKALVKLIDIAKTVIAKKGDLFNNNIKQAFGSDSDEDKWAFGSLRLEPKDYTFAGPQAGTNDVFSAADAILKGK